MSFLCIIVFYANVKIKTDGSKQVVIFFELVTFLMELQLIQLNNFCSRELCYVCSQRAARNVPVYTRKLEEEAERKNAQILQMAQQRKAEESIQKEYSIRQEQRRQNREVAAFNQGKLFVSLSRIKTDLELFFTK